jgi:hypothetical protein
MGWCMGTEEDVTKVKMVLGMSSVPTSLQISCMSQFFKKKCVWYLGKCSNIG